jgi:hypothetical protein
LASKNTYLLCHRYKSPGRQDIKSNSLEKAII